MNLRNTNSSELSGSYKTMMDDMLDRVEAGSLEYVSIDVIKKRHGLED
ncbi:hypothetical protein [Spongiivirga citrea]|uniref:Uncharacterized protein n=1 Tax=Spongiivirga citrea TaxID=1481457 RepID=A0A6M0CJI6_9FLAO|nr:hypothetical protein [Spongiivirga citrea]NER17143.1 hypothetical protein [Spongiivirga citrea]